MPVSSRRRTCRPSPTTYRIVLIIACSLALPLFPALCSPSSTARIVDGLRFYQDRSPHPMRAFFDHQIKPRLDCRHVSVFVVGQDEIRAFIERQRSYFEQLYQRSHPNADMKRYDRFVEQFIAPYNVEIGTFFFKERFGLNQPFPIILFDAVFDGEGITTVEDLIAALQDYEIPRLLHMRRGIDYGAFRLDRDRFLKQHLTTVKLVLECFAVDHILVAAANGRVQLSDGFKGELTSNYIRYYRMLDRLAEGRHYIIDAAGNPFYIETPLDLELARAQLMRMHFKPLPDPSMGRYSLLPVSPKPH